MCDAKAKDVWNSFSNLTVSCGIPPTPFFDLTDCLPTGTSSPSLDILYINAFPVLPLVDGSKSPTLIYL